MWKDCKKEHYMNMDTYIVMKGYRVMGYVQAYNTYHALRQAEKWYGENLIVERISQSCKNS